MSNDLEKQIAFNWQGDLDDDCGAYHDNLLLRAEQMDTDRWWWAVNVRNESGRYDEIASSNDEGAVIPKTGSEARAVAEEVARRYLGTRKHD